MNNQSNDDIRDKIIGLGESSIRKSYYPQLKKRIDEIEELNRTLEDRVKERTQELNQKNSDLKKTLETLNKTQKTLIESEKIAALGTLVSGIAHEINTPIGICLTGITYFMDIVDNIDNLYRTDNMSQEEFENFLKSSKDLAKTVNSNITRAAELVQSFKKISVEQNSSENRKFNLHVYIQDIVDALKNKLKKNQHINVNIPKTINIFGSPSACYQISTNLIINTLTHGFNENENGTLNISAIENDANVVITYKDDGKGIKEEDLPKIFEPFFTTNRSFGGTGLGLNLVYNIISSQLGGTITCKSKINQGAEFTITIPKSERQCRIQVEK